jgi:hypothetical protein
LGRLFKDYKYKLEVGGKPEKKFRDVVLGNARLSGKLDRIDTNKDSIEVIDYKTGKGIGNIHTKDKSKQVKAWKYKTQLCFYNLLLINSGFLPVGKEYTGKMVFVETEDVKYLEQSYQPSREELEYLSKLIQAVWGKIINFDLPETNRFTSDFAGILEFQADLLR